MTKKKEPLCPSCHHAGKYHAFPGCTYEMKRTLPIGLTVDTCGCTGMNWVGEEDKEPPLEEGEQDLGFVTCPMCKGKNTDCKHCKGKGKMKMRVASTKELEYNSTHVDTIMDAIEQATGIKGAFITDLSSIGDFLAGTDKKDKAVLAELSEILGFDVKSGDSIVSLAKRIGKS